MILLDRRYIKHFDWCSFGIAFILTCIGIAFIFSATYRPEQPFSIFFKKQLLGAIGGFLIYFLFCSIDFRRIMRWSYFTYFFVMLLLIYTIIRGAIGMGAQRWIHLGFIRLQPSELTKLVLPGFITYYFYAQKETLRFSFREFMPLLIVLAISCLLIIKQPDLGTALLLLFSGLIMLWLAGMNKKIFIYGACALLITAPISWKVLRPYQKQRVLVFLGQGASHKERYQIEQSKIAIGSGGFFGKGFLKGTQNKLLFLPESRTDFIFSVICEETGFFGALIILLLYLALFARCFMIIIRLKNPFYQLLASGLLIHIILSTIINICMVTGLLPIVGIPLPLMSYGIANLWINLASLGWLNSIFMRRFFLAE